MSVLKINPFSSYDLTEEEELEGAILTLTQREVIQNELALVAMNKLNLEYDATNPLLYAQQEADFAGQIKAYRFLLEKHESAVEHKSNPEV